MTKLEAIEAINSGKKVTHKHFTKDEWMTSGKDLDLEFEDGCQCSNEQFWSYRTEDSWLTGWSIVE